MSAGLAPLLASQPRNRIESWLRAKEPAPSGDVKLAIQPLCATTCVDSN